MDSQSSGSRFVRLDPYSALIFSPSPSSIKQQHWNTRESFLKRSCWHKFRQHPREAVLLSRSKNAVEKICREFAFRCLSERRAMVGAKVGLPDFPQLSSWNLRLNLLRCLSSAGLDFGYGYLVHLGCANHGVGRNWGANKLILFDINHPFFRTFS